MELTEVEDITLLQKIGEGAFGTVRLGRLKLTGEEVAVKLESETVRQPLLRKEYDILRSLQGAPGVPRVYSYGTASGYNYMAMQLLGNSLSHKLRVCGNKLGPPTVIRCALQMVDTLEAVHTAGFLHRDIKPQNFLIGIRPNRDKVYLIDFGLARRGSETSFFRTASVDPCGLVGTLPYMSVNLHLGLPLGKRDDLESLAYVFIYLLKGSLPWHNAESSSLTEKQVRGLKQNLDITKLCEGLPSAFDSILRYARNLRPDDIPNYTQVRKLLEAAQFKLGPSPQYDWGEENVRVAHRTRSHKSISKIVQSDTRKRMSFRYLPENETQATEKEGEAITLTRQNTLEKPFNGFANKKGEIMSRLREEKPLATAEDVKLEVGELEKEQSCSLF